MQYVHSIKRWVANHFKLPDVDVTPWTLPPPPCASRLALLDENIGRSINKLCTPNPNFRCSYMWCTPMFLCVMQLPCKHVYNAPYVLACDFFFPDIDMEKNNSFWTGFIELYREKECLWNVSSKEYSNKNVKVQQHTGAAPILSKDPQRSGRTMGQEKDPKHEDHVLEEAQEGQSLHVIRSRG